MRYRETQMKTSQFSENLDLCQLGRSGTLTNLSSNIISSEIELSNDSISSLRTTKKKQSVPSTSSSVVAYGRITNQQPSTHDKTAKDLHTTNQEGQRHQQILNKKRKRDTGKH